MELPSVSVMYALFLRREDWMHAMRWLRTISILGILTLTLSGCGESGVPASTTLPAANSSTTTMITTTTPPPTTTTEGMAVQVVQVVFASADQSDCSNVAAFDRSVDSSADPIEAAFDELVGGPIADEIATGAGSMFSAETAGMVRAVSLNQGLLIVDFEDLRPVMPNASTSCGSFSLLAQLNGTAFQFAEVERVTYQIDGSCETFFNWLQGDCREYPRS